MTYISSQKLHCMEVIKQRFHRDVIANLVVKGQQISTKVDSKVNVPLYFLHRSVIMFHY